tara:strand:- start:3535 stop:5355 length:1821 start_codon:yes stop_codon:yes gene_type:complete
MAKTLRTSGDYTIKAGDGFDSGSGTNTITLDSLDVTINGNLTVGGTSAIVNTTNTTIEDNIIELNTGASANTNNAGIIIERGTAGNNAAIVWKEDTDSFVLGTTTATAADKSTSLTVAAGALEVAALTATTGSFSSTLAVTGAATFTGGVTTGALTTNSITSNGSNAELSIQASGTGDVLIGAIRVNGTTLDSSDSTTINVGENLIVGGTVNSGAVTSTGSITSGSSFIIGSADINETDLEKLDGITNGTVEANKAVVVDGNLDASGFRNLTTTGTLTIGGGITTGLLTTNEIISNGSNATITVASSGTGDAIIDAGGDIILDADNADIKLQDGGTEFGRISRITSDLVIKSMGDDKDIILKGVDDSATINALTLDMSAAGAATFNNTVTATGFIIGSADINETDLEKIDGITNGTVSANKAVVVDANLDASGFRNVSATGTLTVTGATTVSDALTATSIVSNTIASNGSNADITLDPEGTGKVTVNSQLNVASGIDIGLATIDDGTKSTTSSSIDTLDTFVLATHRSAEYTVSMADSTNSRFGLVKLYVTHDGSNAFINSQGISSTGSDMATFTADIDSGNVRIRMVPISADSVTYKFTKTLIEV